MKTFFENNSVKIYQGNCLEIMKQLPESSVDCCITSPPYWALRDYENNEQIGLEETPEEYIRSIVKVFDEVYRILKKEGTVWLNLGDSYFSTSKGGGGSDPEKSPLQSAKGKDNFQKMNTIKISKGNLNLRPKSLVGIPWRVAFALQEKNWILRQDIIWHKPNAMPESVNDRCTKAHEYIFLLTKNEKYYYNASSILEPVCESSVVRSKYGWDCDRPSTKNASLGGKGIHTEAMGKRFVNPEGRNKRSVWTVPTASYKEAHFATFPIKLIEPCVLAGCPEGGVVLDPFGGSGTTAVVATLHKRKSILCDLNKSYCEIAKKRILYEREQHNLEGNILSEFIHF